MEWYPEQYRDVQPLPPSKQLTWEPPELTDEKYADLTREERIDLAFMRLVAAEARPMDAISEPVHPDCDMFVVVPASNETLNEIFGQIYSLHSQKDLSPENLECIVVVNNSPEHAAENTSTFQANQLLIQQLNVIRQGFQSNLPRDPLPIKLFTHVSDNVLYGLAAMINCGLRLHVIDCSSPERAIPDCNVGKARHTGVLQALQRAYTNANPNAMILQTDADSSYALDALSKIRAHFASDTPPDGIRGKLNTHHEVKSFEKLDPYILYELENFLYLFSHRATMKIPNFKKTYFYREYGEVYSGAHQITRAGMLARVRGVPQTEGAEDVALSMRMNALSPNALIEDPSIIVHTHSRISNRTPEHQSYGAAFARLLKRAHGNLVHSFQGLIMKDILSSSIHQALPYKQYTEYVSTFPDLTPIPEDLYYKIRGSWKGQQHDRYAWVDEAIAVTSRYDLLGEPFIEQRHPPEHVTVAASCVAEIFSENAGTFQEFFDHHMRSFQMEMEKRKLTISIWIDVNTTLSVSDSKYDNQYIIDILEKNTVAQEYIKKYAITTESLVVFYRDVREMIKCVHQQTTGNAPLQPFTQEYLYTMFFLNNCSVFAVGLSTSNELQKAAMSIFSLYWAMNDLEKQHEK